MLRFFVAPNPRCQTSGILVALLTWQNPIIVAILFSSYDHPLSSSQEGEVTSFVRRRVVTRSPMLVASVCIMAVTSDVQEVCVDGHWGGTCGRAPKYESTQVVQKSQNALSSDITAVKESERMLLVCLSADSWSCAMRHQPSGRVQLSMSRESSLIWVNRALYSLAGGHPPSAVTIKVSTSGGAASIRGTVALVSLGSCATKVCSDGLVTRMKFSLVAILPVTHSQDLVAWR